MPLDIPGGSRIVVLGLAGDEFADFPRRGTLTPLGEADDGEAEADPRRIFRGTSLAKRPRRGAGCSGDVSEIVKLLSLAGVRHGDGGVGRGTPVRMGMTHL